MYEDFFQLKKRPFAPVGPVDSFVEIGPFRESLDLLQCALQQGQSIVLLIGPPGSGKSHLCKHLAGRHSDLFSAIYLSTAGFHTRRALLQAILYELGRSYVGLSEQESRLQILEAARNLQQSGKRLLLVLDEAQLLSPKLCEELRTLIDYAPTGTQQIQLVLAGTLELEEQLFAPELQSFNQRIGAEVLLTPLSMQESVDYLLARLTWAEAADAELVFDETAIELICRASDGNVRCLNQLADHALLVAYVDEMQPVSECQVRQALDDLKLLPLHFQSIGEAPREVASEPANEARTRVPPVDPDATDEWELDLLFGKADELMKPLATAPPTLTDTDELPMNSIPENVDIDSPQDSLEHRWESTAAPTTAQNSAVAPASSSIKMTVLEFGAEMTSADESETFETAAAACLPSAEIDLPQDIGCREACRPEESVRMCHHHDERPQELVQELVIQDRYAQLDDHFNRADGLLAELSWNHALPVFASTVQDTTTRAASEESLLALVETMREEVGGSRWFEHDLALGDDNTQDLFTNNTECDSADFNPEASMNDDWLEYDVIQPGPMDEPRWASEQIASARLIEFLSTVNMPPTSAKAVPNPAASVPAAVVERPAVAESPQHPVLSIYTMLFDRLRWRRRALQQQE